MDNIRCNIKKSIDEIIKINIKLANLYSGLSINNNVIKFKNIPIISEGLKNSKTNLQELASVEYVNQIAGGLDRTETLELTGSPISLTTTGAIQINNNDLSLITTGPIKINNKYTLQNKTINEQDYLSVYTNAEILGNIQCNVLKYNELIPKPEAEGLNFSNTDIICKTIAIKQTITNEDKYPLKTILNPIDYTKSSINLYTLNIGDNENIGNLNFYSYDPNDDTKIILTSFDSILQVINDSTNKVSFIDTIQYIDLSQSPDLSTAGNIRANKIVTKYLDAKNVFTVSDKVIDNITVPSFDFKVIPSLDGDFNESNFKNNSFVTVNYLKHRPVDIPNELTLGQQGESGSLTIFNNDGKSNLKIISGNISQIYNNVLGQLTISCSTLQLKSILEQQEYLISVSGNTIMQNKNNELTEMNINCRNLNVIYPSLENIDNIISFGKYIYNNEEKEAVLSLNNNVIIDKDGKYKGDVDLDDKNIKCQSLVSKGNISGASYSIINTDGNTTPIITEADGYTYKINTSEESTLGITTLNNMLDNTKDTLTIQIPSELGSTNTNNSLSIKRKILNVDTIISKIDYYGNIYGNQYYTISGKKIADNTGNIYGNTYCLNDTDKTILIDTNGIYKKGIETSDNVSCHNILLKYNGSNKSKIQFFSSSTTYDITTDYAIDTSSQRVYYLSLPENTILGTITHAPETSKTDAEKQLLATKKDIEDNQVPRNKKLQLRTETDNYSLQINKGIEYYVDDINNKHITLDNNKFKFDSSIFINTTDTNGPNIVIGEDNIDAKVNITNTKMHLTSDTSSIILGNSTKITISAGDSGVSPSIPPKIEAVDLSINGIQMSIDETNNKILFKCIIDNQSYQGDIQLVQL